MFEKFLSGNYALLKKSIESGENVSVFGLNIGEKLAVIDNSPFLFYVVDNPEKIWDIKDKLEMLGRSCDYLTETISPLNGEFSSCDRVLSVLNKIKNEQVDTLILTPNVIAGKYPKSEYLNNISLKVGDDLDITKFTKELIKLNYKKVEMVGESGDFSVRGDIVDIFPINCTPTRISTDYGVIESIKEFNPATMLNLKDKNSIEISTNNYVLFETQDLQEFYDRNKLKKDAFYEEILESFSYMRLYFCAHKYSSIFDYVKDSVIVFDGAKAIYDKLETAIKDNNEGLHALKSPQSKCMADWKLDIKSVTKFDTQTLVAFHYITENNRLFTPQKVFSIRTLPTLNYYNYKDGLKVDVNNYLKQGYTIILAIGSPDNEGKFRSLLGLASSTINVTSSMSLCAKSVINLVTKKYPLDIILPDEKLVVISSTSLLGKKKKIENKEIDFFDGELPMNGDYVVHNFHGIGKCLGVETLKLSNASRDYVVIEYKNNDKLYLPVENIDQISKYLGSDKVPSLSKIGGVEFGKTKARVKAELKKVAFDLIALYKDRMNKKGILFPPDDDLQKKFENSFNHTETADQLKAIEDAKKDMENGKIMDRLICGDVGFGKTEVAIRIAFKTILSGYQVVFLCPTTILSAQHYTTIKSRMADFGVRVEVLNRLKSNAEVEKIKKDLKDGKIDIIIGTHKVLSNDISYKNLGLLILDEEQKFGVADKDKIKNIKKTVNVLTLSATPIPRTLNLSLIGVRDISVIETPPFERINSVVKVLEYSDELVKRAIESELSRGGQVLIIYNRVESIYGFAQRISALVPDAKINVAHGQMPSNVLEKEIFRLYSGETQVLISTTLIENGVDLPNANTLIVINADKLGLSQLYQLKGRIGRSNKESFAYFTFQKSGMLSENAYKRLQAIEEFSEMGSGFKIAMRDLEIRGAGSVLGLEQSGHIEKIGYNMYVELLNESINELSNVDNPIKLDVKIETNLPAYLSHDYIESSQARMKIYREIARINSVESYEKLVDNTTSIYGDISDELINLFKIGFIKNLCQKIGIIRAILKPHSKLIFAGNENLTQEILKKTMDKYSSNVTLNFESNPVVEFNSISSDKILDFLIEYLQFIISF